MYPDQCLLHRPESSRWSEMCNYRKPDHQCSSHCPESLRSSEMCIHRKHHCQCSSRCPGSSRLSEMCTNRKQHNARHGHTFDCMRNIGFGNGRIATGNGSCRFIEREIAAFHSIFHFPTAFTAVVSGCRFPGISFVSALTNPITTVRMRRFVLRTAYRKAAPS